MDDQARANREAMPMTARIVADFKRRFGADCRVAYVQEGDQERGKRLPVERSMNADQWLHYVMTGELPCSA
jgi:hypothetical protein